MVKREPTCTFLAVQRAATFCGGGAGVTDASDHLQPFCRISQLIVVVEPAVSRPVSLQPHHVLSVP